VGKLNALFLEGPLEPLVHLAAEGKLLARQGS
jgi:hypothetical protein